MTRRTPNSLGVLEAVRALDAGELRSIDLVEACLERIQSRDATIGAWTFVAGDAARAAATRCDHAPRGGRLHGIPLAVKDIIDTVDMPTECGSSIYRGRRPAWDAACVAWCRRAGAVILDKTVTTEFAYFQPGKTANPHAPAHTPGGSSSGSAAAVADDMVPAAFGTQTAASIIRPASYCGVVGYKPTYGTFSLAGIKAFAESLDSLGLITRSAVDARYLRAVLLDDGFRTEADVPSRAPRVGLCRTPWWNEAEVATHEALERAARQLTAHGANVVDAELPSSFVHLLDSQKSIMAYESARNYAYEFDAHRGALSQALCDLIQAGARVGRGAYEAACADARRSRHQCDAFMAGFDFLVAPSAKGEAPQGLYATGDPLFSRMWTLLHVPSVTLPAGTGPLGLPVGVQLIGKVGADEDLLLWAEWAERRLKA